MPVFLEAFLLLAVVMVNRLGFVYLVNKRLHYTFTRNPALTFLYFFVMTLAVVILFPAYASELLLGASVITVLAALFVLVVVNPWIYARLAALGKLPKKLAAANPDQQFLLIDDRYLLSKTGDVIFQQVAVGILLLLFWHAGIAIETLVPMFALIFAALHFHLFFSTKKFWAVYFTVSAAAAGFALPFIILTVPGGVYYATALHMLWYVGSGALFGFTEASEQE